MKQGLSFGLTQGLVLTPQLQQSIRLLQLSTLELESEVQAMLDSNPFLLREDETSERERFDSSSVPTNAPSEPESYVAASSDFRTDPSGAPAVPSSDTGGAIDAGLDASADPQTEGSFESEPNWDGDGTMEIDPNHSEWGVDASISQALGGDPDNDFFSNRTGQATLAEHLHEQARHWRLNKQDAWALGFLIDSLSEDGFLEDSLDVLVASLNLDEEDDDNEDKDGSTEANGAARETVMDSLRVAHRLLQNLEPCGVGAKDLSECLLWQLQSMHGSLTPSSDQAAARLATIQIAMVMLRQPLTLIAQKNPKKLALACDCPESQALQALQLISTLNPRPAGAFQTADTSAVIPDVFVQATKSGFRVTLNTDLMPRLKIDEITAHLLKVSKARKTQALQKDTNNTADKDTLQGASKVNAKDDPLQQCLLEAKGFIKSISQRFDTVLRVANAIVARQQPFLRHGAVGMRPMVLREIADELGLHESTVSRVTTAKYMATPQGVVEFKYFFDASLATDTGGQTSGTAVRALIGQYIAAESHAKPLSDNAIADMLEAQGISCARRTVAKYREALRIPPVSLRKNKGT